MFDWILRKIIQHKMNNEALAPRAPVQDNEENIFNRENRSVEDFVSSMTDQEKMEYIGGVDGFCIRAVPRLGISPIWACDATSGVRGISAAVTTFPSAVAMAASWNTTLITEVSATIARECRALGVSILLAPGVNLARVPTCGRNFEYLGEDPYLAGEMAAAYVVGAQDQGVLTTVKHFACNNSEYDRHKTNSVVDERTLHELYLTPFRRVVQAGGLGVMTAYNPVNGTYCSENSYLIQDILRKEWGFKGLVMSDWDSLYTTKGPLLCGVDVEMPKARWMSPSRIMPLLETGVVAMESIDSKVSHLLGTFADFGMLTRAVVDPEAPLGTPEHKQIALRMAQEGAVLLKNTDDFLPLDANALGKVVIIGRNARVCPSGGGGSSNILQNLPGKSLADCLTGELVPDAEVLVLSPWWRFSNKGRAAVRNADVVIVNTGFDSVYESEAYDRIWRLPSGEAQCIHAAARLNSRVVAVVHGGGAMEMSSWIDAPKAVMDAFYLGESSSEAIVGILLGKVNPSGKLPFTMARNFSDYESTKNYPKDYAKISIARLQGGQGDPHKRRVRPMLYREGLLVGYRQFDTIGPEPLFPFGHGLSYTTFTYHDLHVDKENMETNEKGILVACEVENSGSLCGAEVVQLYIHPVDSPVFRPNQELKGFRKVSLNPGKRTVVRFILKTEDFSRYDEVAHRWVADPGEYSIRIGSSSRDIRLNAKVLLPF
jgi:beta-glucosidase